MTKFLILLILSLSVPFVVYGGASLDPETQLRERSVLEARVLAKHPDLFKGVDRRIDSVAGELEKEYQRALKNTSIIYPALDPLRRGAIKTPLLMPWVVDVEDYMKEALRGFESKCEKLFQDLDSLKQRGASLEDIHTLYLRTLLFLWEQEKEKDAQSTSLFFRDHLEEFRSSHIRFHFFLESMSPQEMGETVEHMYALRLKQHRRFLPLPRQSVLTPCAVVRALLSGFDPLPYPLPCESSSGVQGQRHPLDVVISYGRRGLFLEEPYVEEATWGLWRYALSLLDAETQEVAREKLLPGASRGQVRANSRLAELFLQANLQYKSRLFLWGGEIYNQLLRALDEDEDESAFTKGMAVLWLLCGERISTLPVLLYRVRTLEEMLGTMREALEKRNSEEEKYDEAFMISPKDGSPIIYDRHRLELCLKESLQLPSEQEVISVQLNHYTVKKSTQAFFYRARLRQGEKIWILSGSKVIPSFAYRWRELGEMTDTLREAGVDLPLLPVLEGADFAPTARLFMKEQNQRIWDFMFETLGKFELRKDFGEAFANQYDAITEDLLKAIKALPNLRQETCTIA